MKKWEKIINKAFNQRIQLEEECLYDKIFEKFQSDQEIKNIISELYIKLKNCDYLVQKQWYTLKKFNLEEKIHREESEIIISNEQQKLNEIFTEAIEKLAACHVSGFEPINIIRKKIINKIQGKYSINEENIKELAQRFSQSDDVNLNEKRREDQLNALKKITSVNSLFTYKEVDKSTYLNTKTEIKKYEKELEIKATQNEKVTALPLLQINTSTIEHDMLYEGRGGIEDVGNGSNDSDDDLMEDEEEEKVKITTMINPNGVIDEQKIQEFKDKTINNLKQKIISLNNTNIIYREGGEFKSEILNDLSYKIKTNGKLSDLEIQVLLYVFHSVTNELVLAKNPRREYSCEINPLELMKFLKMYKIDMQQHQQQKTILGEDNYNMN